MSWIVKNLILNRHDVSRKIYEKHMGTNYYDEGTLLIDFEDDAYNSLLKIESAIKKLYDKGLIDIEELTVLKFLSEGYSYKEVGDKLKIGKNSVRAMFYSLCDRIAFYLGGEYTDDGYVEYMVNKYKLNETEVAKLKKILKANRRI